MCQELAPTMGGGIFVNFGVVTPLCSHFPPQHTVTSHKDFCAKTTKYGGKTAYPTPCGRLRTNNMLKSYHPKQATLVGTEIGNLLEK